jgi:hypothetical protein
MRRSLMILALAAAVGAASCTEQSTSTRNRSSSPPSSSGSSSGDETDSGEEEPDYVFDDGSGSGATWSDLYADFFGPSGRAGCAGPGNACHGSEDAEGSVRSGFVCADEAGCVESMLGRSNLVRSTDTEKPEAAFLINVLRRKNTEGKIVGTQPKLPLLVFHEKSIERIKQWIADGAQP